MPRDKRDVAKATVYAGLEIAMSGLSAAQRSDEEQLMAILTEIFEDALNEVIADKDKHKNL